MQTSHPRLRETGFSLLEAILVVAILGLLAAIAIPSIIASLRSAREARGLANCRAMGSAEMSFFANRGAFGIFDDLFRERFLGENFVRNVSGTGASEIISDGAYRYKISYILIADGITVDADPESANAVTHRWFRFRLGRVVAGPSGGEGTMYVAPANLYTPSPPSNAYRVFAG